MAKKKSEIQPLQETVATVKTKAQELNAVALKNTDKAIDSTIKAGKEWQSLLTKSIKNGSKLASNQQGIIFDTLEGIKSQAMEGRKRWNKLFDFSLEFEFAPAETLAELPGADFVKKAAKQVENQMETAKAVVKSVAKEATKMATETSARAEKAVKTTAKATTKTAKTATKKVTPAVKKATKTAKATATKTVKAATKKATPVAKKVTKTAKAATKKTTPTVKKVTKTIKTTAAAKTVKVEKILDTKVGTIKTTGVTTIKNNQKDDLKKIAGIGPKIERLLNIAGIKTFAQLATAKDADLRAVLTEAGPRFKMHNPADWNNQAKKIVAAK
ncbi:MAG: hypothetical protein AB8G22_03015 [Saprospiraceae bacterium]